MVSTSKKIHVVEGDRVVDSVNPPVIDFGYVFPLYGAYFVVGTSGVLYYSSNVRLENLNEIALFDKKPFSL